MIRSVPTGSATVSGSFGQTVVSHGDPKGDIKMTSDVFRPEFEPTSFKGGLAVMGYVGVFAGYAIIFIVSLLTVGFLEIRQANMRDFNALIATLEERDGYADGHLNAELDRLHAKWTAYRAMIASLACSPVADAPLGAENRGMAVSGDHEASGLVPKTCAEIMALLNTYANELSLAEGEGRFRSASLDLYYDKYKDGITQKSPQIIPALRLLDSNSRLVTLWARSPFELIEMFLLVCMGMLGGAISVMRSLVDPAFRNPTGAEFFYKPAAGAAISLGVYVLFRAAQIFLGAENQSGGAAVSTSIFLLAGLGLASGFCATEALGQIESVAKRLLKGSGRDADRCKCADKP